MKNVSIHFKGDSKLARYTTTHISNEPQSKEEIENLKKEKLKNLSLSFELDLIRFSKSIKHISQSEKISKDHISYIENRFGEFQETLSKILINSIEFEALISRMPMNSDETNGALKDKLDTQVKKMTSLLNAHLTYSRKIKEDLEKRTEEYVDNLYTISKRLNQELMELDSRLTQQQNSLSNTFVEMSALDDRKSTLPGIPQTAAPTVKNSPDALSDSESPLLEERTKENRHLRRNSVSKYGGVIYVTALVIFVALFFMFFREGKEGVETVNSKPETQSSGEASPDSEMDNSTFQEIENSGNREIAEEINYETEQPYSNKKSAEAETISEPQSERRILVLSVPAANLRRGPDKKYPVTSVAKSSDEIQKVDEHGGWIKVKTQSGAEGWIWEKLVREEVQ